MNDAFLYFKKRRCDVWIFRPVISASVPESLVKNHYIQYFFQLQTDMASPDVTNLLKLDITSVELDTTNRYWN